MLQRKANQVSKEVFINIHPKDSNHLGTAHPEPVKASGTATT